MLLIYIVEEISTFYSAQRQNSGIDNANFFHEKKTVWCQW